MRLFIQPGFFRIFLALAVCVSHLSRINIGATAVFVFFMLSGFWSMRMYEEKYRGLPNPKTTFWIARFLRIWVLYSVCVVVGIFAFWAIEGTYDPAFWRGFGLLGVATHKSDILGVSWSLDLEVQFYLLVPAIAAIITGSGRLSSLPATLLLTAGLTVLGWFVIETVGLVTVMAYLATFMAGALIYSRGLHVGWKGGSASFALFIVVGILIAVYPPTTGLLNKLVPSPFESQWFAIIWALLLIPFVAFNVRNRSTKLDRHLGNLSYSVYLVHFPFYALARSVIGDLSGSDKLILLALTIPVSLIPYLFVDRVIERRREAWSQQLSDWLWSNVARDRSKPSSSGIAGR